MSTTGEPQTYRGNCHCGAFIFEVNTPEIKRAIVCNCSICSKKGYVWLFLPEDAFTIVRDDGLLTEFICGPHNSTHRFCSRCGTAVFATNPSYYPGKSVVNARAIQGLDIWKLETPAHDNAKIEPHWIPPVYSGPEPDMVAPESGDAGNKGDGGEGKVYHGSCRCGAAQIAVRLRGPLDESYKEPVLECNCSICQRGGYIWIYPKKEQIALEGAENLTEYVFGNKVWKKMFCKTCGVHIMTDLAVQSEEEWAALPEEVRKFNDGRRGYRPVNVRAFNEPGFDPLSVKAAKSDGWNNLKPAYVNP